MKVIFSLSLVSVRGTAPDCRSRINFLYTLQSTHLTSTVTMTASTELLTSMAIDSLFMLVCIMMLISVLLGVSMFYSGLTQRRSAFTMLTVPLLLGALVFIDWFIWGYSLCYGSSKNHFIGSLKFAVLNQLKDSENQVYVTPRGSILSIVHFLFNGFMKSICVCLTFPACIAERGRLIPMLVFLFFWSAIVYNPVTYWFWNRNGWLSAELDSIPVLDFAGGNCIHVVSGFTALAYSFFLGPRNPKILVEYRSSNNTILMIGVCFIVFGWGGFISGCDYKFSAMSFYILTGTFLCAASAGIAWTAIDYYYSATPLEGEAESPEIELQSLDDLGSPQASKSNAVPKLYSGKRKLSMVSLSSGMMCGLVVFTPGGGYLSSERAFWKSIICGLIGGASGNLATQLKYFFKVDDALDVFAVHGVCGIVGSLLVGFFADDSYSSLGGWTAHHWVQLGYQLFGSFMTSIYSFVVSLVLLYIVDKVPGLHLRIDQTFNKRMRASDPLPDGDDLMLEEAELLGTDWYEFNGEYAADYYEFIKVINPDDFNDELQSEGTPVGR